MATDFEGAGGQPLHAAQSLPPEPEPPLDPVAVARQRRMRFLAWTALVLGLFGLAGSIPAVMNQAMPRKFTAAQRQQITDWEYAKHWRALPVSAIFPGSVSYPPPADLDANGTLQLSAHRIGIASEAACASAADPSAAEILDKNGCATLLRATYADKTDSYVLTVGVAVLPSSAQAAAAAGALMSAPGSRGLGPTVRAVSFDHTPAAAFSGSRRQLSGVVDAGTYVVLYTVGFADSRPRQQVTEDHYAENEMTSAGWGVAHAVLSVLAAPVPAPHCPGTPGC